MVDNKFFKKNEGFKDQVYMDTTGNPTVGHGTNLNSPEVPELLRSHGIDPDAVLAGQPVPRDIANVVTDKQLTQKREHLGNIKERDFPGWSPDKHKQEAIESMYANNAQLIGPGMRKMLNENDTPSVIKEILLNSNKKDDPGIEKRRIEEAERYGGEDFQNIVDTLTDDEKYQIRDTIKNIKNMHERNKVLEKYPFLNQIYKPRFGKIPIE